MRFRASSHRKDTVHREVVEMLERCGYVVLDLSAMGGGCPDLLAANKVGAWLVEVKTGKGKLRKSQLDFQDKWPTTVPVLRSAEDVIDWHQTNMSTAELDV